MFFKRTCVHVYVYMYEGGDTCISSGHIDSISVDLEKRRPPRELTGRLASQAPVSLDEPKP